MHAGKRYRIQLIDDRHTYLRNGLGIMSNSMLTRFEIQDGSNRTEYDPIG